MIKAKDVMNTNIVAVDPDDPIEEVMSTMIRLGISGLPVVDMAGQLLGIITEFDLLELVWNPNTSKNKVYHYMTREVRTVNEEDDLVDVAELFRTLSIRRLVVMHRDQVVGILSRRDLIWHALKLRGQLPEPQMVRR
ncbi:MAG: CBS domain-containing protein [Thermoguttaceae bacterium]|jgi:CBS domain-containing protein